MTRYLFALSLIAAACSGTESTSDASLDDGSLADGASHDAAIEGGSDASDGAIGYTCDGTPVACHERALGACESGMGCELSGACSGHPTACGTFDVEGTCTMQSGCTWNDQTSKCVGVATQCFLEVTDSSCNGHDGCEWDAECTGIAASCASIDIGACESQPGCDLVPE